MYTDLESLDRISHSQKINKIWCAEPKKETWIDIISSELPFYECTRVSESTLLLATIIIYKQAVQ